MATAWRPVVPGAPKRPFEGEWGTKDASKTDWASKDWVAKGAAATAAASNAVPGAPMWNGGGPGVVPSGGAVPAAAQEAWEATKRARLQPLSSLGEETKLKISVPDEAVEARIQALVSSLQTLPPGTVELPYSITAQFPVKILVCIAEDHTEFLAEIQEATKVSVQGVFPEENDEPFADVDPDAEKPVSFVGSLLAVYTAHIMLLRKRYEIEEQMLEEAEDADETLEEVAARIEDLKRQLSEAEAKHARKQAREKASPKATKWLST
mmetsp:Transcript_34433/g.78495  ORF Transcript_34433/g.78495 Transcript_34433/m.78495 type:complete len:266 (-) Transcript_34433:61-858(-)